MQTIIVRLNPVLMRNPDLDIRYVLPDTVEAYTDNSIMYQGYDYLNDSNHSIGIWLSCMNAERDYLRVLECFREHPILNNDLLHCAEIYISTDEVAKLEDCIKVYPLNSLE
ncbi:hypothetical protein [Paenibacillus sanguinis]|uniref:hypothetical protein n=1 Tax=Paenibacillus sanguinis TaxID=225906 RepID=UPI00037DAB15|nr:hypothetical protein [Paenibacillus sanguinis]